MDIFVFIAIYFHDYWTWISIGVWVSIYIIHTDIYAWLFIYKELDMDIHS